MKPVAQTKDDLLIIAVLGAVLKVIDEEIKMIHNTLEMMGVEMD